MSSETATLSVENLRAHYGPVEVLHGVDIGVFEGEVVALLGPNGAGKTSLLRAISGELPTSGRITYNGERIDRRKPHAVAQLGIGHLPEGRGTFADLSVAENLKLACISPLAVRHGGSSPEDAYDLFPELRRFRHRPAGAMSGGQQQMLAVCRAVLSQPRLLLIDEPCIGLAPKTSEEVFDRLRTLIANRDISVLLAEQNMARAFNVASRGYVLSSGNVVVSGTTEQLRNSELVRSVYLGKKHNSDTLYEDGEKNP